MAHTLASRAARPQSPRQSRLRLLLALALILTLVSANGCMVMDELDTAAAKMPTSKAELEKKKSGQAPAATASERLAASKRMLDERTQKWWSEAKTMTPGEAMPGIVRCRLPEGTQFRAKDDCLSQGGEPLDDRS